MTKKKQIKTEIPTETAELFDMSEKCSSTTPDEPTHKNILDSVYDLSDFFRTCLYPFDNRLTSFENKFDKLQENINNIAVKQGEIDGKLNILLTVVVAIFGFLLYQHFTTVNQISERVAKLETFSQTLRINDIYSKLDKHQDQIQELKFNKIITVGVKK